MFSGLQGGLRRLFGGGGEPPGGVAPSQPPAGLESSPEPAETEESFPQELQDALLQLLTHYESIYERPRREYVRKCLRARQFWRGNQYVAWNENSGLYSMPRANAGLSSIIDPARTESAYVINRYQAFGLSLIALIAGNRPTEKFFPMSSNPEDVKAAQTADRVIAFVQQNAPLHDDLIMQTYYLWTDGRFGSYVRYAVDGDRFGWREEPILVPTPMPMGAGVHTCPSCGATSPPQGAMPVCPQCGAALPPESLAPAPMAMGMRQAGTRRVPNGQEVRDVVGGLELSLPFLARDQSQYAFLCHKTEVDKAQIRARFPAIADKIIGSGYDTDNTVERNARLEILAGTSTENQRLTLGMDSPDWVTFARVWFRPWAFQAIDDESLRAQLLQRFPDGCYVSFGNGVYCESRPENMDDHWRICNALPGDGQAVEAIGASMISAQEAYNDLVNIERDVAEFTLPYTFVDSQVVDVRKFARSRVRAGAIYDAVRPPGTALAQAFYTSTPGQLSQHAVRLREELGGEIPQHLTGVFPAAYGGDSGANDTAHGIAIERDQAMGRIGMYWGRIKEHEAEVAPLYVKAFMRRIDPVTVTDQTGSGRFRDTRIDPTDLKNGQFRMHPETVEDYPTTWPQRRAALMAILGTPAGPGVLMNLKNTDELKRTLGCSEIEFPGEAGWKQQMNEIEDMAQGTGPTPPGLPTPMAPMGTPPQSSVPVEPLLEDHMAHLAAGKSWWESDAREELQRTNPPAVIDIQLHMQEHQAVLAQQQMQAAMAAAGPAGPPQGQGDKSGGPGKQAPPATVEPGEAGLPPIQGG